MKINIDTLPPAIQYKLLSSTIVPRPIALITTFSQEKGHNAAPFSFFNAMGEDPPVLAVALENKRGSGDMKDTTVNIRENGEFVVHMVDVDIAQAMNICAIEFPPGINEVAEAGLTLVPSSTIRPHRIQEAPVAFECEKIDLIQISPGRHIVIGKIRLMHIRDGLLDPESYYIDPDKYRPVGRMFGRLYTHTHDHFEMAVPEYEQWLAGKNTESTV